MVTSSLKLTHSSQICPLFCPISRLGADTVNHSLLGFSSPQFQMPVQQHKHREIASSGCVYGPSYISNLSLSLPHFFFFFIPPNRKLISDGGGLDKTQHAHRSSSVIYYALTIGRIAYIMYTKGLGKLQRWIVSLACSLARLTPGSDHS